MSTRSIVTFVAESFGTPEAHTVYVHHDGYPSYRGPQLMKFLNIVSGELTDPRLHDAGRTAARFTTFMMEEYRRAAVKNEWQYRDHHLLGTISVKLVSPDVIIGDAEYMYVVKCDSRSEVPEVLVFHGDFRDNLFGTRDDDYVLNPEMVADAKTLREVLDDLEE